MNGHTGTTFSPSARAASSTWLGETRADTLAGKRLRYLGVYEGDHPRLPPVENIGGDAVDLDFVAVVGRNIVDLGVHGVFRPRSSQMAMAMA